MGRPLGDGRTETRAGLVIAEADRQRFRRANRSARTDDQIARDRHRLHPEGLKKCQKCRKILPLANFGDSPRERDGLHPRCFACRPVKTAQQDQEAS